jgi:peptidoglycan/xylan/chitin deacetylase (PgdA/CDA1 family)
MVRSARGVVLFAAAVLGALTGSHSARAADCPGHPGALGTSRTIVVDPHEHTRLGTMQYPETLPLGDKEVVLTFDDGPLPPFTTSILDILARECVKATYFLVGRQARAYPALVRRIAEDGHSIGTHSQNHPLIFDHLSAAQASTEIEGGIASARAALGPDKPLAPFFRFPGLGRSSQAEAFLAAQGLMAWSADFPADDWTRISDKEIVRRAMSRLEAKGKGILLLHDIHPATVLALPQLFAELKARGYRIVHVVPATAERPKTPTVAQDWLLRRPPVAAWPPVARSLMGLLPDQRLALARPAMVEPLGPTLAAEAPFLALAELPKSAVSWASAHPVRQAHHRPLHHARSAHARTAQTAMAPLTPDIPGP